MWSRCVLLAGGLSSHPRRDNTEIAPFCEDIKMTKDVRIHTYTIGCRKTLFFLPGLCKLNPLKDQQRLTFTREKKNPLLATNPLVKIIERSSCCSLDKSQCCNYRTAWVLRLPGNDLSGGVPYTKEAMFDFLANLRRMTLSQQLYRLHDLYYIYFLDILPCALFYAV